MKDQFVKPPPRITENALRQRCRLLATNPELRHILIEGYEVHRMGRFTGVSLGNIEVCVYFGVQKVLEGRFNQIAGSLKMKVNRDLENARQS